MMMEQEDVSQSFYDVHKMKTFFRLPLHTSRIIFFSFVRGGLLKVFPFFHSTHFRYKLFFSSFLYVNGLQDFHGGNFYEFGGLWDIEKREID